MVKNIILITVGLLFGGWLLFEIFKTTKKEEEKEIKIESGIGQVFQDTDWEEVFKDMDFSNYSGFGVTP